MNNKLFKFHYYKMLCHFNFDVMHIFLYMWNTPLIINLIDWYLPKILPVLEFITYIYSL